MNIGLFTSPVADRRPDRPLSNGLELAVFESFEGEREEFTRGEVCEEAIWKVPDSKHGPHRGLSDRPVRPPVLRFHQHRVEIKGVRHP